MTATIEYKGVNLEVSINHQPAERQTLEHQGCEEYFEIDGITLNGVDVSRLLEDQIEEIDKKLVEYLS
jgi:hypothetical protein